jgi:hypothetical protein
LSRLRIHTGSASAFRIRPLRAVVVAALTAMLLLPPAPAQAYSLGGWGKRGASSTGPATCKFGVFGTYSLLTLSAYPPRVTGARARRGREFVRYRAYLVNTSENVVNRTGWSGWIRVRDNRWRTWSGITQLSGDWRGNYYLDYRIEWWSPSRRIGLRDLRIYPYYYYSEHNEGPMGPFTSCLRQPV